ncbi:PAQR family membrane homeostasis protein TrhA [Acetivibrio mesophilus]|uniref:Hemolysin III family protein n=1 Tax=Acetivibrio mesophilus TaxID=2487273 RepID=A0A4Q0I5H0_9FIRM|nr:hemolysin III family protein [Acetivibrio mesophilus]ODM27815.1 hemolysin III [Clostridium sp. Bc-iso-3]RXE59015.1 hemolysin III family protein [Acetivibrio mesophilus]HHV30119.1 hemolysin III family protein [Clostridium sp.]
MSRPHIKLTFGEEVANTISHGVASLAVLFAFPFAAITAYNNGSIADVLGVTIFCISIFLMFLMSTLYHAMEHETAHKTVLHILDHIFIYFAIAGTYTPVAISVIGGWQAVVILIIQWSMVLFGILYKSISRRSMPKVSLIIYLVMGWTLLIFMPLFVEKANPTLFWMILGGGIFYSLGAIIYARKGFKYHHMVWHISVFLGALTHFIGICFFMY